MELENKIAVVTGGSLGIGRATALEVACQGAHVAINYRQHAEEANQVVKKIREMGRKALAVQADVARFSDARLCRGLHR